LSDDVRKEIERAVAAANSDHSQSIALLEEIVKKAPLPVLFNNLGVEYARAKNTEAAQKAFSQAIAKDPTHAAASENLKLLASNDRKVNVPIDSPPSKVDVGPAVKYESGSVAALVVEPPSKNGEALQQIHVVNSGAGSGGGSYSIKYQPTPGSTVLVEPGKYDVLVKTGGGGLFTLAKDVVIKEQTTARINPNAVLGTLIIEPLNRKEFPQIKELFVVDTGSGRRLIRQWTDKLGAALPIAPGQYDILCKTVDNVEFDLMKSVSVGAGESKRIVTDDEIAAIVVYEPKVQGLNVKEIYALQAGTNQIAGKSDQFGKPIMVYAGGSYDVALQQQAGLTRLKSNITPKRGTLTEIR
jgi:hypothetical protein